MRRFLQCFIGLLFYAGFAQTGTLQKYIVVDQFGYRPGDDKVAVIADPQEGFNSNDSFSPGNNYQVRRLSDDAVMLSGSPVQWNNGATDSDNGDRGWWFDFSLLDQIGDYYIYDVQRNRRSHVFHVSENVYEDVLKAAMRTFYYQRLSNTGNNITKSFGDDPWKFSGRFRKQDNNAIDVNNQVASTSRDMSGGWMDAGDSNKYVTFAEVTVHQLLTSYTENKNLWDNLDLDIPESNNSTPDILDEVKFELDWLLKMQDNDGGVFIKIGQVGFNHPDVMNDNSGAFYEKKCSSSTLAAAGMYAHGSMVFQSIGMNSYANTLRQAAIDAWDWFANSSKNNRQIQTDCDPKAVRSGDADRGVTTQNGEAATAALYLWVITGNNSYHTEFLNYYQSGIYIGEKTTEWGMYEAQVADAFELYLTLPNNNGTAVSNILSARNDAVNDAKFVITSNEHLYRADNTQDHWGNTKPRANIGNVALKFRETNANSSKSKVYKKRALNILHGFHGVNALQMSYLTNMGSSSRIRWGAESSANALFHTMFKDGSDFDNAQENNGPAPGYVVGGPNSQWTSLVNNPDPYNVQIGTTVYNSKMKDQPKDKLYTENLDAYDESLSQLTFPYALTENSITYQSAYVKLLANFVGKDSGDPEPDDEDLGTSNDISTTLPATIERGKSTSISINYTVNETGNIFISLLDSSTDPYSDVGDGVNASSNVSAGSGTVTLQLDVPANTALGTTYAVYLNMFNSDYSGNLATFPTTAIEVVENTGGEEPDNNNINATIPAQVSPGETVTLNVSYTANASANIFAQLFDTSGTEWISHGDGASQAVSAGSGNVTLLVDIPANTPIGTGYILYLNMFNQDWSSTLASFPNTAVSVVGDDPDPGNGDIVIRARGTCGSETMELRVDGSTVQTWNNIGTSFTNYTYTGFSGGAVEVAFTNDANDNGCDRNLAIDRITVCDEVYETEDTATRGPGCGDDDNLWCTGYFNYGTLSCNGGNNNNDTTYYYIRNKQLGDYLRPASAADNAQILVQDKDNSDWFLWEKVATSNGHFYLKNKESGKYFRPADNADVKTDGSVMAQKSTGWSGSYTQWTEVDSGDGTYVHLANRQTGLYFRALSNTDRYLVARPTSWSGSWTRWVFEPTATSLKASLPDGEVRMLLYPNPAKNSIVLTHSKTEAPYAIYDLSGRTVKTGNLSDGAQTDIDITTLESGMYLLRTSQKTFKFIKE